MVADVPCICNLLVPYTSCDAVFPTSNLPPESIRIHSLPLVSAVIVSALGNLSAVFVSPVWIILSAIDTSPVNVLIPAFNPVVFPDKLIPWKVEIPEATCSPVVFPNILNPLAVTIPTESTLVTSSYVKVPPIDIVPGTVRSPFLLTVTLVKVTTPAVISLPSSCCALPVFSGNIKVLFPATAGASSPTNPDVDPFNLSAMFIY